MLRQCIIYLLSAIELSPVMKIALLGDIALFGRYCLANDPNLLSHFYHVRNYLSKFDIVVGNLETPFIQNERPVSGKSATICSNPLNIKILKEIGVTHVNLANNHIGDFGLEGYKRTKSLLDDVGIGWFGTEDKYIRVTIHGEKIALLGFCSYNTNPSPLLSNNKSILNYLDASLVRTQIDINSNAGFLPILSIHSGQEHVHMPSLDDIYFARSLANQNGYVYYGHHPHVVQGYEELNESVIFYSLGNFLFDDVYTKRDPSKPLVRLTEANKTGIIASFEVRRGRIVNINSTPLYLGDHQIILGDSVKNFDEECYNTCLREQDTSKYELTRSSKINLLLAERKKLRDFSWYLRRLNFNSMKIILNARKNSRLYRKFFASKLQP